MYEKPICDCGEPLYLWREEMYEIIEPININGTLSKTRVKKINTGVCGAYDRLYCIQCFKRFNYIKDKNGRFVKTESWIY